jgi:hypothetical protein
MNDTCGKFNTAAGRWAGIGPYYAMFPKAFCDAVIENYCKEGDTVFDPFAGRGTALYSAAISGRRALGVELNPVGWIYSRTKLAPARMESVAARAAQLQIFAHRYATAAAELPIFFTHCFTPEVRRFLLCARDLLNWRQDSVDRTLMAFLLVHLHGKLSDSFSNQMRQTKAMAPRYAVRWWKANGYKPPRIDPVNFLQKKMEWRYARGIPRIARSNVYLGDSVEILSELKGHLGSRGLRRPSLLLTSPPYFGITNYHYDQWLRLWLLGGPPSDRRPNSRYNGKYRRKFENRSIYANLLTTVFERASRLMRPDGIVYVRTDRREPTLALTKKALKLAFPDHQLNRVNRPIEGETQTRLFGNGDPRLGEVDLVLTP